MSQTDTNECSNNNKCSYFCFGLPNKNFSCQCPDNMIKSGNICLCPGEKEPFANGTCPSGISIHLDHLMLIVMIIYFKY